MAQVGAFSTTKRDGTFEGPIVGPENFLLLPVEGDQPTWSSGGTYTQRVPQKREFIPKLRRGGSYTHLGWIRVNLPTFRFFLGLGLGLGCSLS